MIIALLLSPVRQSGSVNKPVKRLYTPHSFVVSPGKFARVHLLIQLPEQSMDVMSKSVFCSLLGEKEKGQWPRSVQVAPEICYQTESMVSPVHQPSRQNEWMEVVVLALILGRWGQKDTGQIICKRCLLRKLSKVPSVVLPKARQEGSLLKKVQQRRKPRKGIRLKEVQNLLNKPDNIIVAGWKTIMEQASLEKSGSSHIQPYNRGSGKFARWTETIESCISWLCTKDERKLRTASFETVVIP